MEADLCQMEVHLHRMEVVPPEYGGEPLLDIGELPKCRGRPLM